MPVIRTDKALDTSRTRTEKGSVPDTHDPVAADRTTKRHCTLDDLSEMMRALLSDHDLEVSKVRPFFWSLVEAYVDRFQDYPFDVVRALSSWLETRDYPAEDVRGLVRKIEAQYAHYHGKPLNEWLQTPSTGNAGIPVPDQDDRDGLRHAMKYAAILGDVHDHE